MAAPPTKALPSRANVRCPSRCRATVDEQPAGRGDRRRAAVGQQETARAVGDLGQTRRVAALAEQRRLLVAAQGGDGQRLAETTKPASRRSPRSCRQPRAAPRGARRTAPSAPRPRRRCGCRRAVCAKRWSRRSRAAGRRSGSRRARNRPCRRRARRGGRAPRRRRYAPGSSAAWWPRSRDRSTSPVRSRTNGSWPATRSSRHSSAVRRSCQTMAGATGSPPARSHTTVVSRWLAMATAATCAAL